MQTGFDVCLHNKRLNMLMTAPASKQSAMEEPPPSSVKTSISECNKSSRHHLSEMIKSGTDLILLALIVMHIAVFIWSSPPLILGPITRKLALILTPCILIYNFSLATRMQAFALHLAGVYDVVVSNRQDAAISLPFYFSGLFIILYQISMPKMCFKGNTTEPVKTSIGMILRQCINVAALMGVILQICLKYTNPQWELGLDVCFVTIIVSIYVIKFLPV